MSTPLYLVVAYWTTYRNKNGEYRFHANKTKRTTNLRSGIYPTSRRIARPNFELFLYAPDADVAKKLASWLVAESRFLSTMRPLSIDDIINESLASSKATITPEIAKLV